MFVLRVLSELSLVLLAQDGITIDDEDTEEKEEKRDKGQKAAEGDEGSSSCPILGLITKYLLPRSV